MDPKGMKTVLVFFILIGLAFADNTTFKPIPNPTDAPITDGPKPDPKPDPKPIVPTEEDLKFQIKNGDEVCALFNFLGTIYLPATTTPKANETTIPLSNLTTLNPSSSCDKDRTSLVLNINGDKTQTLNLTLHHINSTYKLNVVTLKLSNGLSYTFNDVLFSIDDSRSYLCSANPLIELTNVNKDEKNKASIQFRKLKVDAFRKANDENYRSAIECDADFPSNDFVPLAVGCALIALVFMVLVAYIVGRRRSRRLTYQSV